VGTRVSRVTVGMRVGLRMERRGFNEAVSRGFGKMWIFYLGMGCIWGVSLDFCRNVFFTTIAMLAVIQMALRCLVPAFRYFKSIASVTSYCQRTNSFLSQSFARACSLPVSRL